MTFPRTRELLARGLDERAYPAAVCEVGRSSGPMWRHATGRLSYAVDAAACTEETVFDLASLTKVISTTSLVMREAARARLSVDNCVREFLPEWQVDGADHVVVGGLLDHSSGLPAHVRLWQQTNDADRARALALSVPLERRPGAASVYSDVGFILLGVLLERVAGKPLGDLWSELWPSDWPAVQFNPPPAARAAIAPTEQDPWRGRLLQGEVHDENAALLGGVAAHAGLFGTAPAVGQFAATVLQSFKSETWLAVPDVMRRFASRQPVPGSSRALGWDTMLPTSSCGTKLSSAAIGHTGFTGTSLWIDPVQDLYVVLLTNRVHPTRANERFPPMRSRIHDAIVEDLESTGRY